MRRDQQLQEVDQGRQGLDPSVLQQRLDEARAPHQEWTWAVLITQIPSSWLSITTVRPANYLPREICPLAPICLMAFMQSSISCPHAGWARRPPGFRSLCSPVLRPERRMPSALPRNGVTGGDGFSNDPDTLNAGAPMIWQLISAGSSALRITREPWNSWSAFLSRLR